MPAPTAHPRSHRAVNRHPHSCQAIFTLLPLRVGLALLALARSLLGCGGDGDGGGGGGDGGSAANGGTSGGGGSPRGLRGLRGDQLYDLLGAGMSVGVVLFLWNLNAGTLYFWMKVRGWGRGGMRGGLVKA